MSEFELNYCEKCIQMTNHLDGVCQKCKPSESIKDDGQSDNKCDDCSPKFYLNLHNLCCRGCKHNPSIEIKESIEESLIIRKADWDAGYKRACVDLKFLIEDNVPTKEEYFKIK